MGVLRVVWISKSGLGILIRALEVPFLVPPKTAKMGRFGGTKNGTSGATAVRDHILFQNLSLGVFLHFRAPEVPFLVPPKLLKCPVQSRALIMNVYGLKRILQIFFTI